MKKLFLVVRMWPERLLPVIVFALALCAIVVCLVSIARRTRLQLAYQHPWGTLALLLLLWITHALCLAMGIVWTVYIYAYSYYSLGERARFSNDSSLVCVVFGMLGLGALSCITAILSRAATGTSDGP
jgi:hypothetical protein